LRKRRNFEGFIGENYEYKGLAFGVLYGKKKEKNFCKRDYYIGIKEKFYRKFFYLNFQCFHIFFKRKRDSPFISSLKNKLFGD